MNKKIVLIPELRFPEFINDGEWDEKTLEEIAEVNPATSPLPKEFVYVDLESVEKGLLLKKRIIKKEEAPSRAQRLLKDNDVIFQMVRPYQKNNYFFKKTDDSEYVASTGYAQLRAYESNMYLYQYLHTDNFVDKVLDKCTGSNYPAINSSDLSKIRVLIPKNQEQQRIASCLSSLDEVIAAQHQKLQLLKEHKKGLMQNLFPQEGENIPKYRFKGFENEKWEEKNLGEVVVYFKGFAFQSKDYTSTGRRIVRVSDMGFDYIKNDLNAIYINEEQAKQFEKWKLRKEDLIVTTVGSKPPAYDSLVGRTIVVESKDENALLNQNAVCLRANKKIEQGFLNILFKRDEYVTFIKSIIRGNANQGSIALEDLFKYKFFQPKSKEQHKISSCLSALDKIIAGQTDKIEQLKLHKKGLMQDLFPKIDDLNGNNK
jgi:type I restriction enzyme S subunit